MVCTEDVTVCDSYSADDTRNKHCDSCCQANWCQRRQDSLQTNLLESPTQQEVKSHFLFLSSYTALCHYVSTCSQPGELSTIPREGGKKAAGSKETGYNLVRAWASQRKAVSYSSDSKWFPVTLPSMTPSTALLPMKKVVVISRDLTLSHNRSLYHSGFSKIWSPGTFYMQILALFLVFFLETQVLRKKQHL